MGNPERITITVLRSSGLFQKFEIPATRNISILEALYYIWEYLDPSFAFSYSCRVGICHSCLVQANGRPVLACRTLVKDGMRIEPAKGFKQILDTIVDLEHKTSSIS